MDCGSSSSSIHRSFRGARARPAGRAGRTPSSGSTGSRATWKPSTPTRSRSFGQASRALLPFSVYWDGGSGEYRIESLQDEPPELSQGVKPKPAARPYLHEYREQVTLRDNHQDLSLNGYRVQDFAITHDPDRLVSAVAIDPKTESEAGLVEVRGSILSVSGAKPTLIGCRFEDEPPLVGSWSPG